MAIFICFYFYQRIFLHFANVDIKGIFGEVDNIYGFDFETKKKRVEKFAVTKSLLLSQKFYLDTTPKMIKISNTNRYNVKRFEVLERFCFVAF